MAGLNEIPETVYRGIVAGILLYFVLLIFGYVTGTPLAVIAAHLLFGFLAIAIGAALYQQARGTVAPIGAAGLSLISGGIAQLLWLVTGIPLLETVSTLAVFAGIALYVYAVWIDN
ncbi:hypothetical protein [Natrononativus amylolyticus]|uniref:hypothetical protein n=1 Tax=Natrononativus amylolyticus TaxID=2963434 RepID=UPI0020CD8CC7|nr:hypothetical protein [Natrononativus amylolyticus]